MDQERADPARNRASQVRLPGDQLLNRLNENLKVQIIAAFPEAAPSFQGFNVTLQQIKKFGERGILATVTPPNKEPVTFEVLEAEL